MSAAQTLTSTGAGLAAAPTLSNVHTISLFVHDRPGVLVRVAIVFARRGYNIESRVVSPAAREGFSRMTITCSGDPDTLEQIIKQVSKLIDVIHCYEHTTADAVVKEMLLVKFVVEDGASRTEALQIIEHFNGKTVDLTPNSMIAVEMLTFRSPRRPQDRASRSVTPTWPESARRGCRKNVPTPNDTPA